MLRPYDLLENILIDIETIKLKNIIPIWWDDEEF